MPVGAEEDDLVGRFLDTHDFAAGTRRLIVLDLRQFARWFTTVNREPFVVARVTVRDVIDFRDYLRREKEQAVATVNRSLVLVRRFFAWLAEQGIVPTNPAKEVKELRRVQLAPKGLDRSQVRRLLREVEVRHDIRAASIFSLCIYTGCRVGDLVNLEPPDVIIAERSGSVLYRFGKGGKERSVPLPLPARRVLQAYLDTRPPVESKRVFIRERGPLTDRGMRALFNKYGCILGVKLYPHLLRHTMAHQFLDDNNNDLVALAQILGHKSLTTTARYVQRTQGQLEEATDRLSY
jgi:integrase/recombinase XerC